MLKCDVCEGQITVDPSGEFGDCDNCGHRHDKVRVAELSNGVQPVPQMPTDTSTRIDELTRLFAESWNDKNYNSALNHTREMENLEPSQPLYGFYSAMCLICLGDIWQVEKNIDDILVNPLGNILDMFSQLPSNTRDSIAGILCRNVMTVSSALYEITQNTIPKDDKMYAYNCHVISKFISVMSNQIIQNTGKSGEYINGHKELMVICDIIECDSENTQTSTQTAPVNPQGQPFSNEEVQIETLVSQALELAETDSFLAAAERLRALKQQYPHNTVVNFCYSFYAIFFHNDWNLSAELNNIFASYEQFLWRIKNSTFTSEEHENVLIAYGNDLYGVCRYLFNAAYEDSGLNQNPNNSKTVKALNVFRVHFKETLQGLHRVLFREGLMRHRAIK